MEVISYKHHLYISNIKYKWRNRLTKFFQVMAYDSQTKGHILYPKIFWSKFQAKKYMKKIQKGVK